MENLSFSWVGLGGTQRVSKCLNGVGLRQRGRVGLGGWAHWLGHQQGHGRPLLLAAAKGGALEGSRKL